ncbi:hypothetical protein [Roseovarius sp. 2305UL8-3]|uniref:hypothetical protein n=1 Tax=Roseovarius conchicola TaxID=3121636 RepID=UPI003528555E
MNGHTENGVDRSISVFGAFLSVAFGLAFSEFVSNTTYLFPYSPNFQFGFKTFLGALFFTYLVLLGFEAFVWFDTGKSRLLEFCPTTRYTTYTIFLLEYFPIFFICELFGDTDLSDVRFITSFLVAQAALFLLFFIYQIPQAVELLARRRLAELRAKISYLAPTITIQLIVILSTGLVLVKENSTNLHQLKGGAYFIAFWVLIYFVVWLRRFIKSQM